MYSEMLILCRVTLTTAQLTSLLIRSLLRISGLRHLHLVLVLLTLAHSFNWTLLRYLHQHQHLKQYLLFKIVFPLLQER